MGDFKAQHGSTPTTSVDSMPQSDHDNHVPSTGDDKYYGSDDDTDDVNQRLLTTDGPSEPPSKPECNSNSNQSNKKSIQTGDKSRTKDVEGSKKQDTVKWRDLPEKGQLVVLTLARLSEPLVQTSLQSYMFYQLKSFRPDLPTSAIASQSGILHASFTAAQFLTAMIWGRLADSQLFGRKTVLMIGLAGTLISCLGFGFSQSFGQALFFRSIGGATNGNVGVLRTMISEIVREKKYQSRAFLIMPLTFNIGVIVGPILGGLLSDPAHSYPGVFGANDFLLRYPYAAPNLVSAFILFAALLAVWLGLEETLDSKRDEYDFGIDLRRKIASLFCRSSTAGYTPLAIHSRNTSDASDISCASSISVEMPPVPKPETATTKPKRGRPRYTQRLAFRRIFTKNVIITLLAQAIWAFHMGTFNSIWFVFLSTPVYNPAEAPVVGSAAAKAAHYIAYKLPFFFTGGIGMQPRDVGFAMAILGCIGIAMQLLLYPMVSARLGIMRSWRIFLCCFPLGYFAMPYLSLVPSDSAAPHAKDGVLIWLAISAVLLCHVTGRTFVLPAQTILVNNCTPHPSVLGTLHGIGLSTSSLARTVGPMLSGYLYGWGFEHGLIGAAFWGLSIVAILGFVSSLFAREGNGHEVWLEGDLDDEE